MKHLMKRSLAMLMVVMLLISMMSGLTLTAAAATVDYQYGEGDYSSVIKNWGTRGELATFLSPNAEAFYAETSYETLAANAGSSDLTVVNTSALYTALYNLMSGKHTTKTSYEDTKNLFQYTDIQKNGSESTKISAFYSGELVGPAWDSGTTWNREHVWPNSKGGESSNDGGGINETDIMMLRPETASNNSSRGNNAFGVSDGYYNPNLGSYDLRGDVARILLYTYVRWGTEEQAVLDNMWGSEGVIESKDVLLDWVEADPVDTWEMARNDSVQSITGTRNVFVDYPELAFDLFEEEVPVMDTPSGEAAATDYVITAVSNNEAYGTVSVNGNNVTASPADGYQMAGYEVTEGTASVAANGNVITVSPSSDCTIQVNFSALPSFTVKVVENGIVRSEQQVQEDQSFTLPELSGTLPEGYSFCGWVTDEVATATASKPATVYLPGDMKLIDDAYTFYALVCYLNAEDQSNPQLVYQLVDSEEDLVIGSSYVIAAAESNYALSTTQNNNNRGQAEVTKNGTTLTFEPAAGVAELTLQEGIEIEVTEPVVADSYVYTKITTADELVDGDYLIVYEDGPVIFDGSLTSLDAANNNQSVTITNNTITAEEKYQFTIAAVESGYTIKSAGGYYIGQTSDANGLKSSTSTQYTNTITFNDDGSAQITGSGKAVLRYNANSGNYRFRYFKSTTYTNQKAVHLYKKTAAAAAAAVVAEETATATTTLKTYAFHDAANNGYLYAASSGSNHLKTQQTLNENGSFVITVNTDGSCTLVAQGENTHNDLKYNSSNSVFACYASGNTMQAVALYVGVPGAGTMYYTTASEHDWETEIDTTDPTESTDPETSEPAAAVATKITTAEEFVSGKYVMVVSSGYGAGVVDGTWITAVQPVISENDVTDAAGGIWTLAVTDSSVTIQDANGVFIAPKGGNSNGLATKEYSWAWAVTDGLFTFSGVDTDTVQLASNTSTGTSGGLNRFRGYKTTTVTGNSTTYLANFTLYKVNETEEPTPDTTACPHTNTTTTTVAATCTVAGSETVTCDDCGVTVSTTELAAGHSFTDGVCSVCGIVETPVADTAYRFGMVQENVDGDPVYYITGVMAGYYMATTDIATDAAKVYLETTDGGYYLYTYVDDVKTYINMVASGTYVNGAFEATASTVYTIDADKNTVVATISDTAYWFGTRNDKTYTTMGPVQVAYNGFGARFYPVPTEETATAAEGAAKLKNDNEYFGNGSVLPTTVTVGTVAMDVTWAVTPAAEGAAVITDGALVLTSQAATTEYTLTATVSHNGETATATWTGKILPSTLASVADGDYVIYFSTADATRAWTNISGDYGYIKPTDVTIADGVVSGYTNDNLFVLTANGDGTYTIVDNSGRYVYLSGDYDSFNVSATKPETGAAWYLYDNGDGNYFITNAMNGKVASYDATYSSFGSYADSSKWTTLSLTTAERIEDALIIDDGTYLIHLSDGTAVTALDESKKYDYLPETALTVAEDGTISGYMNKHIFTFTKNTDADTYTIVDNYGRYLYMSGNYNNFSVSTTKPEAGADWKLVDAGDGAIYIKNTNTQKIVANGISYNSFGAYADVSDATAYDALLYLTAAEICKHANETSYDVAPTLSAQGYTQYVCADCGELLNQEDHVDALADVDSWGLTLGSDLSVNFRFAINSSVENPQASVTIADGAPVLYNMDVWGFDGYSDDGKVEYYLLTVHVSAAQMQDEIKIQIISGEDATNVKTYTVESYAKTVLADETMSQYHQVLKDMLNYGATAQVYFGHNAEGVNGALPNAGIEGFGTAAIPTEVVTQQLTDGAVDGISFYAASLVHKDRLTVRLYFKVTSGSIEDYAFTDMLPGYDASAEERYFEPVQKGDYYYIEFADIAPNQWAYSVYVYVIKDSQTLKVEYAPLDYIIRMNNKATSSTELKNMLLAMYNYHLAAFALDSGT